MKSPAAVLPFLSIALTACLEHPIAQVELCKLENPDVPIRLDVGGDVDILFVIDNSGSMAEEQARLARNFEAFARRLDQMGAHYRIGVTTTDSGNPRCDATVTTPEGGDLVLRSCLDRLDEGAFKFNDIDAAFACTDVCGLSSADLAIVPTSTDLDPERRARPWIESIDGITNLPADVAVADAFACFGPQGIDGCGHEQPLESMYLALKKALSPKEGHYGFMREDALLSVVLVTDEADCSFEPAFKDIFMTDKTFWEDLGSPAPTSAACWNAGVACSGPGPVYAGCEPENFSIDGEPGAADGEAVLRPISRYVDLLSEIRADKQRINPSREVLVSLIAGVPPGYEDGAAEIPYAEAEPGSEQDLNFGIAPGCVNNSDGSGSTAVPPVRERAVAEAFAGDQRNLYSICQDDYTSALEGIARQIEKAIAPVCGSTMVADRDLETEELEADCKVQQIVDGQASNVPACEPVGADEWAVPAGSSVCAVILTDPSGLTPSKRDDMTIVADPEKGSTVPCADRGTNVEFKLHREGPRVRGATYTATCLSEAAEACR
ncbi:vWA domain-containing protein [Nannocystis sp. SCPEA4]|uniref:vWA domain-containing protein n=1 Tax=Nannocystis sp. SCPEA4 TaxID=2996787 RepID=UPI00226F6B05|nr:vWA domain-containing protein [Nannocystis sp. SCPEA4]MCY1061946.1 VWA domain-containing protein [Nannocystis sp. SCPEA4]